MSDVYWDAREGVIMRVWRRRTARLQKHISIIIVSSDAPQAVSFRFSRLWGGVVI
ncbi:MAG: hypothetical protein HY710_03910, partial [Candidatus Latescibacteria bacterium]|nr:hypothetical protein [Candidatus Latescibacterota bacterium]